MIKLKIDGMNCGHCKAAVEEALQTVTGVDSFTVDLPQGEATIEGNANPAALIAAVEERGYDVRVI